MSMIDTEVVLQRAKTYPSFLLAARYWTAKVAFDIGDDRYLLEVVDGAPRAFWPVPERDDEYDIRVFGSTEGWDKLLRPVPPPHFDHVSYGSTRKDLGVEGDVVTAVGPYFAALQEFVAVMREVRNGTVPVRTVADVDRAFDSTVGRYVYIKVAGVQYRVYFEEAGTGDIPMVLQHTAGADARQWRHVLEDPDYQRLYRMIAYDLPFHGRSLPPTSVRWWETEYRLTRDFLMDTVVAISHALDFDRPVFMGCSIGGHLAPDLALYHPDEFRAVVGINGGLGTGGSGSEVADSWYHPRLSNEWKSAVMLGNTAPTSPEAYRRETTWIYGQGAPAALKGDVYYYSIGHDLTAAQAQRIDTEKVGVYLLTGEYDFLATDEGTAALARNIPGSYFRVIPGLGHFGPSENPEDFKPALLAVLEEIARTR
ncbi:MAG TPA: alpha/beta hydrolase [Acidimicrobiales bacterium]|nr:alpha/beta hydrolase [Acidimicrobiales bacterium]